MKLCDICNETSDDIHKSSETHRFNYLLFQWKDYRKGLVKNRNGIEVSEQIITEVIDPTSCTVNKRKGKFAVTISSDIFHSVNNKLNFKVTVKNIQRENAMYIMKATILVPYQAFSITDPKGACNNNMIIELKPNEQYDYTVVFELAKPLTGSYKIPLAFTFQSQKDDTVNFTIAREIVVVISDFDQEPKDTSKSPFKFSKWEGVTVTIPLVSSPRYKNAYMVPDKYRRILMTGLNDRYVDQSETNLLNYVRECLCPGYIETKQLECRYPTESNYKDFYHFLLWLDEIGQRLMLQRYNMDNVTMTPLPGQLLELEVPGLAEKRPSLIGGDTLKIRLHKDHTVYKATVKTINDKTIWINNMNPEIFNIIQQNNSIELDVAFECSRLSYERMHNAVDECVTGDLLKLLFPSSQLANYKVPYKYNIPNERFFNKSILNNNEQKTAVLNILNCTSKFAPYIVFGPPGTGKTLTIVEAILQILQFIPNSKILVCAPANAACDMITAKLVTFISKKNMLIRIHAENRNWDDVPADIKPYSNFSGKQTVKVHAAKLSTYGVVITTLGLIGKYAGQHFPDYVFIDEAAQALEPEADIAISMLVFGKQLVLAGDPKQLGPQCASDVAAKYKLQNSLLERLMETNSLYKEEKDSKFITMLKLNYRAHPLVLHIPNQLFYENKLLAVNKAAANDPISRIFIHPLTMRKKNRNRNSEVVGLPVEFCAVNAKEQRHGKSPSYFNESEVGMVVKYVDALLSLSNVEVLESEIGVVTPYIRQVHRIKDRLHRLGHSNIEVGTTEVFQGREKRIIIISTVRAQNDLLLVDKKYKLGFVKNERRMNVALTRAMSKLIIIGHPVVLGTCPNWESYIKFCERGGAYFGAQYLRRTREVQNNITQRFSGVPLQNFGRTDVAHKAGNLNVTQRQRAK